MRCILAVVFALSMSASLLPHRADALDIPGLAADSAAYARSLAPRAPATAEARAAADRRAEGAIARNDWAEAQRALEARIALGEAGDRHWLMLAEAWVRRSPPDPARALQAAWRAFQLAPGGAGEVPALLRLAEILAGPAGRPDLAVEAMAAVVQRDPSNGAHRQRLAALRRAVGIVVRGIEPEAESDPPRACITFSDALSSRRDIGWSDWVRVEPPASVAVTREDNRLCVAGLAHGRTWRLTLREGLPGVDGASLGQAATVEVTIPDRQPRVVLQSSAFILPRGDAPRLTVGTVNLSAVALRLYRVPEQGVAGQLREDGAALRPLSNWLARTLAEESARLVWEGTMGIPAWQRNELARTALDLAPLLAGQGPGLFALTAAPGDGTPFPFWSELATQWFVVTDIGLAVLRGADGLTVLARALSNARPLAGLRLALIARDNDELAVATTDADGVARFPAPLLRGRGAAAPRFVSARAADGDFAFLDLDRAAFDLSDRGVEGRAHPGPLDAWLWTERGIYRPGETVKVLALLRDAAGDAAEVPLTLRLRRPNGTIAAEAVPRPDRAGGYVWSVALSGGAPQGAWTIEAFADPVAPPIGRATISVADFVPERLAVEIGSAPAALVPGTPLALPITARFLYGPAAAGLAARGEVVVSPDPEPFAHLAGWRFGLAEDVPDTIREDLLLPATDAQGRSTATILLPRVPDTTRPLRATVSVEVSEPGGRPTRARVSLPVRTQPVLVGVRPRFAGSAVAEGEEAAFDISAFDAEGRPIARSDLRLRLVRERPDWRVVIRDRLARYETVWRDEPVEATVVAVAADRPLRLSRRLDWGRYRLEVADAAGLAATSVRFRVGFVSVAGGGETPDLLDVAADRATYRHGETARVRLEAPFAGTATVLVLTDRVRSLRTLAVPRGASTVEIPVDRDWGAGAYAAVMLVRGRTEAASGPVRALGLAWLGLDPAFRTLPVAIEAPALLRPRARAEIVVRTAPSAQVALAAVDEGILELTGHAAPDPAGWFMAKRRLGLDIRDDYGRLILPAEGTPGILRQGGDEDDGGAALPVLPFSIASLFEAPRAADAAGVMRFRLEVPDVNTALRLAAVAWEGTRTGAAAVSVPVRDRLVAEPALPRFLAPGDEARVAVSLHNLELPAGTVRVALAADGPVAVDGADQSLSIAADARARALFGLRGTGVGVATLRLTAEGPDGFSSTRLFPLTVRPARPVETTLSRRDLAPGATLDLGADALARFLPGTAWASVTVNTASPVDDAALARALEVWPYTCLEQVLSQGLPLVFLGDDSPLAANRRARLEAFIRAILDKQRFDGAFGLWSAGDEPEPWLTAYAVEFLVRARDTGAAVPQAAMDAALRWLALLLGEPASEPWRRAAQAYAVHALALAGRPRPGMARVLADQGADRLPTPLARGQLGAALVRMGDRARGEALLREAAADPRREPFSQDYGSTVRDAAMLLVLVRESGVLADRVPRLLDFLPADSVQPARTSTQEQAWLIAASATLGRDGAPVPLAIDGRERAPAVVTTALRAPAELPLSLRNLGQRPISPRSR